MADPRSFGMLQHLSAEALGQPGQRRFRLRAMGADNTVASLWLEKEQLSALGDAIETVLGEVEFRYIPRPLDDAEEDVVLPLDSEVEFRIGQLSMGVDRETQRIVLMGTEAAAEEDEPEAISMEFDFRRGHELREQIALVVSAGRPPCPLCSGPLDPQGHVCPRQNGHHPQ